MRLFLARQLPNLFSVTQYIHFGSDGKTPGMAIQWLGTRGTSSRYVLETEWEDIYHRVESHLNISQIESGIHEKRLRCFRGGPGGIRQTFRLARL